MSTQQGTNEHEGDTSGEERGSQNRELSLFQYGSQQLLQSPNGGMGGGVGAVEYHLPTSNLLPQHRLESSSRIQLQLLQPYTHMNEAGRPCLNCLPHHQTTPMGRTQEIQFRGLVGTAGAGGTNSFYPAAAAAGPSSYHVLNTQQDFSSRNAKMRMTLQDKRLQCGGQLHQQGTESPNPPTRSMRNSVYDQMYEEIGLPVDPHLRMFLAKRNQGKD